MTHPVQDIVSGGQAGVGRAGPFRRVRAPGIRAEARRSLLRLPAP